MPVLTNLSPTQNLFTNCLAPAVSHAVLFAGAAIVFTEIDPVSAAITGALMPITDYILDKLGSLYVGQDRWELKYAFTRMCSYVIATVASNALGFPISFLKAIFLSVGSQCIFVGVATIVSVTVAKFFTVENRYDFTKHNITRPLGQLFGLPLLAIVIQLGIEILGATVLRDPTFLDPDDASPQDSEMEPSLA